MPYKFTTFQNEDLLYLHKSGEALVIADVVPYRAYVAVTKDGMRTDYPMLQSRDGGSITVWDNPEWFTKGFRDKCLKTMLLHGRKTR